MKKLLAILTVLALFVGVGFPANRLTTWSNGQVLTHTALNAEFDNIYIANVSRTAGYWGQNDNIPVDFGTSQDAQLEWDTIQTQDSLWLGLSGSMTFIITDKADAATDYAIAASTDPMMVIHSADATTATDYIALSHNQTDAVINAGGGGFSIQAAGTEITDITSAGDWVFKGTTPTITIGDAGEEDAGVVFDGNAVDFYMALDDTTDDLIIGEGSTVGTEYRIVVDSGTDGVLLAGPVISEGTFSTEGTTTLGNAVTDSIVMTGSIAGTSALIFEGTTVDTIETILSITDPTTIDKTITFPDATGTVALLEFTNTFTADQTMAGTSPTITFGDASNEDAGLLFNDATADYYIAFDDTASSLIVGSGLSIGSNALMNIKSTGTEVEFPANTQIGNSVSIDVVEIVAAIKNENALWFDGATDDTIETIFAITDPTTSDKTITFPDATGTVALLESSNTWTGALHTFNGTDNQEPFVISGNRGTMYAHVTNAATDSIAGIKFTNDATYWTAEISSDDTYRFKLAGSNIFYLRSNATGGPTVAADAFTINGITYSWPATDGNAGEVLKTDGSGNLDWVAN